MAISSNLNRSPSPNSSRTNSSSRIQENSCSRKSFSGDPLTRPSIIPYPRGFNPVTPANSPADFAQRNSGHREGLASLRVSFEQNENEKDQNLKPTRVRSPAVSTGTKSFMAPTISAASKINASPRKKVLTERNEAVRNSTSISAGKSPFTAINPSEIAEEVSLMPKSILDSKVPSEGPRKSDATLVSPDPDTLKGAANPNNDGAFVNSEVAEEVSLMPKSILDSKVPSEGPRKSDATLVSPDPDTLKGAANPNNDGAFVNSEVAEEVSLMPKTILDSKVPSEGPRKSDTTLVSPDPDTLKGAANLNNDGAFVNSEVQVPTETPDSLLFSPQPRTVDSSCNNADLDSKVNASLSPSLVLASLDLDPSLPPYDPKTNYLSPRPQFLHYKPNPRIDVYLSEERGFDPGEGKRLLESFSSESGLETENSVEPQTPSTQKECEDGGSSEIVSKEENENQNEFFRVNGTRKSHVLTRSKSISLLLVLVVACLCFPVTDTPIHYPSLFQTQTFSRLDSPAKFAELAKLKLDVLSLEVRLWSVNSVSYLSKLISIPNGVEQKQSFNSSFSDEEHLPDLCPIVNYYANETEERHDIETVENVEDEIAEIQSNVEFEEQPQLIVQASDLKPEIPERGEFLDKGGDFVSYANIEVAEECSNIEIEEQSSLLPQVQDVESDISEADSHGENDTGSFTNIEPTHLHGSSHGLELPESSLQGSTYRFPERNVVAISSVVVGLVALLVSALIYLKQSKASAPKAAVPVEQLATKRFSLCSVSASSDHLNHDRTSSPIWPAEVKKVGESGPSEMSSTFQGSSNCSKKATSDRANEVQSHERKMRRSAAKRESLVSSSEFSAGSISYGSFTTYEKIQSKHGSGDEGMVTPIRRSSRIRNQITSP